MKRPSQLRRRSRRESPGWALLWSLLLLYLLASTLRYRFANPEQTETELFLNLWEALTWR